MYAAGYVYVHGYGPNCCHSVATVSLVLAVSGARDGILALLLAGHAYELGPIVGWDVRIGVHGLGLGAGIASPMSTGSRMRAPFSMLCGQMRVTRDTVVLEPIVTYARVRVAVRVRVRVRGLWLGPMVPYARVRVRV